MQKARKAMRNLPNESEGTRDNSQKIEESKESPTLLVRSPRHPCAMEPQMPPPRIHRTFSSPR
eukprot:COSAG06_NODE_24788_length_652_cov_1.488246_1_plen_62_part_10